jgi:peptidoglycan/LPS O-acetylase OafA/YrhL
MQKKYIELPSLTIGRGIAALIVAIYHATPIWGQSIAKISGIGWTGVSFFFVLSGFVLTWSFDDTRTYKTFIVNRISRIYPLHIFGLLTCIILYFSIGSPLAGYVGTSTGTALSILLVHGWVPQHPEIRQSWDGVSWTLSIELFFYLIAPAIIRASNRANNFVLVNIGFSLAGLYLIAASFAVSHNKTGLSDFLEFSPIARAPEFIYGIIACRLVQRGFSTKISLIQHVTSLLPFIIYTFSFDGSSPAIGIAMTAPAFVLFIMNGARVDIANHAKGIRKKQWLLEKLGEISFSLYMTHAISQVLFAMAIAKSGIHLPNLMWLALNLILVSVVAQAIYKLIEVPGRKLILSIATRMRQTLTK